MDNVRHIPRPGPPPADDDGLTRVPPQDIDAEQSVLGGMLLSRDAIQDAQNTTQASEFYRPAHETIYRAITSLHAAGEPADPITVTAALRATGDLDRVGGPDYLHHLVACVPTVAHVEQYAAIVHERAIQRRLVEAGTRIVQLGYKGGDLDGLLAAVREETDTAVGAHIAGEPGHLTSALLDWGPFFALDFTQVQLLPGRLMAPGQQITVVGDGKAGKSLFVQEWAWRMATGQEFLGDAPQAPISVLYLDAENGQETVQERFRSFGAGHGQMGLLSYASFPPVRPLDTAGGGTDVLTLATAVEAQIVVIDTVSRFISGPENDADTWLSLYRHTLLPLKRAGLASIRLDHLGKDSDRGARGSSAKTQDVDHVWTLTAQGGGSLMLKRTHTRTGIGPDSFALLRQARRAGDHWAAGGTRHIIATPDPVGVSSGTGLAAVPGTVEHLITALDRAGIPSDAGNRAVKTALADLQIRAGSDKIAQAVRIRQSRPGTDASERSARRSGDPLPDPQNTVPGTRSGNAPRNGKDPGQTFPGTPQGTPGTPPVPPFPPSREGNGEEQPEQEHQQAPHCTICGTPLHGYRLTRGYDTCLPCDPTTGSHPNPHTTNHPAPAEEAH